MGSISFGSPELLPLVAVAIGVAALYFWVAARRRTAQALYRGSATTALLSASASPRRQALKAVLVVLALALLGLAAARPRIGTQRTLLQREGTDVILAMDVSLSMSAQDAPPSRLDRAKGAVGALLDHLQGDRIGLVTFAGSADLRFPLTTDIEAARKVVQSLGFKDGGLRSGTSVGEALREATTGFANDQTRSKIVILVSDGDELGDDAASAAAFVREQGVVLNTIGVGNDTPVPVLITDPRTGQTQPRIDPTTNGPLLTAADQKSLRQLASANRGHFYNGNTDDFAVQLADEIGRLQKTRFESGEGNVPIERFQLFAGAGLFLLLLEFLLPSGRTRRSYAWFPRARALVRLSGGRRKSSEVVPGVIAAEPRLGGHR